jgi:uncharacterized membrane protein
MTVFFIGFIALRLLLSAIFFLGLYKIIVYIRKRSGRFDSFRENRGIIILKERFASGEIEEEKYRTMSEVLKG